MGQVEEGRGGEGDRGRLIDAAISIAAVRGFADTTPQMIAERAGLDPRAFERNFDTPDACFLAAWDSLRDAYLARADGAYRAAGDWRRGVRALAQETTGCAAARPGETRLLAAEVLELGPPGRERLDGLLDRLASLIDAGRELARDPRAVPHSTAQGIVGGAHHRLVRQLRTPDPEPPDQLAAELASFAVIPYLGVEAGLEELARSG
jgi:AcrR family transcriptional regulator